MHALSSHFIILTPPLPRGDTVIVALQMMTVTAGDLR